MWLAFNLHVEGQSFRAIRGEIVSLNRPQSPVFNGIDPLDLAWFRVEPGKSAYACAGVYALAPGGRDAAALADFCELHAYLSKPQDVLKYTGTPLVEARLGELATVEAELATAPDPEFRFHSGTPG